MPENVPIEIATAAIKEGAKEAAREWLDEMWPTFGKWTAKGLGAVIFAGLVTWAVAHVTWK